MRLGHLLLTVSLLVGCEGGHLLAVNLRTDLVAGVEFDHVETFLEHANGTVFAPRGTMVTGAQDAFDGVQVGTFPDVPTGTLSLRTVVSFRGAQVAAQTNIASIDGSTSVTVVIGRDCRGVMCPGAGAGPGAVACLGGGCVAPECVADPASCASGCGADADCDAPMASCARAVCSEAQCLVASIEGACAPSEFCVPETGCTPTPTADAGLDPDTGLDSGPPDTGAEDGGSTFTVTAVESVRGTLTSTPAGITCGLSCVAEFPTGTMASLLAAPSFGFDFDRWAACPNPVGSRCEVTEDAIVDARYVPQFFTVTSAQTGTGAGRITSSTSMIDCPGTCSEMVAYPDSITLTADPAPGSEITGWGAPCTGSDPTCVVSPTANMTVTTTFGECAARLCGDTNASETVSTFDIVLISRHIAGIEFLDDCAFWRGDVTAPYGVLDTADEDLIREVILVIRPPTDLMCQ